MKNRLLSLALALALCLGLVPSVSAAAGGSQNLSDSYEVFKQEFSGDSSMVGLLQYDYGLKDKAGNIVIPAKYTDMFLFKNMIFVGLGEHSAVGPVNVKWGAIDIKQNVIVPLEYDSIGPLGVTYNRDTHVYDSNGFIGRYSIRKNGLVGVAAEDFSVLIKPAYRYFQFEKPGYFRFTNTDKPYDDNLTTLYDIAGRQMLPMVYQAIKCLGDNLFAVKKNNLWGVVNHQNQAVVPLIYQDFIDRYKSSFIMMDYREKYKNVSHEGEPPSWQTGEHWQYAGIVGVGGKVLVDFEDYEKISVNSTGRFTCSRWTGGYIVTGYMGGAGEDMQPIYGNEYTYEYINYTDLDITTDVADLTSPFADVGFADYFATPVKWAVEQGITTGTSGNKFSPGEKCTHIQILTFLYRAAEQIKNPSGEDMEKAVTWAQGKGMLAADFNRAKPCTRAEAVSYIWQAMGRHSAPASSFTDVPAGASYAQAVDWAVANGVTTGTDTVKNTFSPNDTCTRGQIVTFLHRAMG